MMQCGRTGGPSLSLFLNCCSSVASDRIMAALDCSGQWRQPGGGRGAAVAGGWREVAVALEDGSVKGGSGQRLQRRRRQICHPPLPLTSHLLTFTFHFLEHLKKGRPKKQD
jgi:hypothetical protein